MQMPSFLALWHIMDHLARKQYRLNQLSSMFTVSYERASIAVQSPPWGKSKIRDSLQNYRDIAAWLSRWFLQSWWATRRSKYIVIFTYLLLRKIDFFLTVEYWISRLHWQKESGNHKKLQWNGLFRTFTEVRVVDSSDSLCPLKYAINTQFSFSVLKCFSFLQSQRQTANAGRLPCTK